MHKYSPQLMAIAFLVSACGGGGGGGSPASTPAPVPTPTPTPAPAPVESFRLTGTITASNSQATDGDTNDPAGVYRANDTVASAQPIPNPITLGGYVNQPGSGAPGRSDITGDIDDYFRVELLAGQGITMLVADYLQADADLYLYDTQGNILDFSIESGELESLIAPRDGTYVVNAFAYEGGTNYILAIGSQTAMANHSAQHFDIVPWQTIIRFREAADAIVMHTDSEPARRVGMRQRAGGPGRARLMSMGASDATLTVTSARAGSALDKRAHMNNPQLRARWETLATIKSLRRDPQVEYAEPNYRVTAMATPDDEAYPIQWHYPLIDLPIAWDTTTGDPGVIVAVVDTGILADHPDLRGQWVAGYDFVRDPDSARDGDGIDPNPADPGDGTSAISNSFHGTHVSGTIAAAGNNRIGVAGVAYSARLMPLRALGAEGGGTSYDVDQAIRYAAGLPNDSGTVPNQKADIINLSLGGAPFSRSSQDLYRQVRAAGLAVVASAGNEASSTPSYPASYEGVISVAAVDAQRRRAVYSNSGIAIDIAAPGGDNGVDLNGDGYPDGVLSTGGIGPTGNFGYTFLSGTSMAAPHVAGVLALMKSVNPSLSPADIDALLIRGDLSDDLGIPGRDDEFGHGLINAQRAVLAALEAGGTVPADNPVLSASSSTLNFSSTGKQLELELRNGGNGELNVLAIELSEPWLKVTPRERESNGLGQYLVEVERAGLADGIYSATIIARSTVNVISVRVIMSVGFAGASADVGVVYILLYDQETDEVVSQVSASATGGRYEFAFNGVSPGRYQIVAGSDSDNDLLICDAGEACGSWLSLDQPITLDPVSDRDDINFPVDYLVAIPTISANEQTRKQKLKTPLRRIRSVDQAPHTD